MPSRIASSTREEYTHVPLPVAYIPRRVQDVEQGYQTMVAYHPLAIIRRPNLWPLFIEDWEYLANHYNAIENN
jgi:uracil-DNA glycosylase